MAILTKDEAKKILDKVLSYSKSDEMSVNLSGGRTGNIRYARNSVSTSGESDNLSIAVTAVFGKKTGTATINEFDDPSLEKTVRRAEEIARLAPENPEYMPVLGPQRIHQPIHTRIVRQKSIQSIGHRPPLTALTLAARKT